MLPQVILTDSTKKGIDKLPFAPFLNKEKIESLRQSNSDSIKARSKKSKTQTKETNQEKFQVNTTQTVLLDSGKKVIEQKDFSFGYLQPVGLDKDTISAASASVDSTGASTAAFMFSDDTITNIVNDFVFRVL